MSAADAILEVVHLQLEIPGLKSCERWTIAPVVALAFDAMTEAADYEELFPGHRLIGLFEFHFCKSAAAGEQAGKGEVQSC